MENCNPVKTPLDMNRKLTKDMLPKEKSERNAMDCVFYRKALGSLIYAYQITRSDLGCAIITFVC